MILAVDLLLIPRLGILGAALSQLLSSVAGAAVVIGLCWQTFRRTFQFSWAVKAVSALILLWMGAKIALQHPWASAAPIPTVIAGAGLYVGLLLASGYTSLPELRSVVKAVVR